MTAIFSKVHRCLIVVALTFFCLAEARTAPTESFAGLVKSLLPAVVNIATVKSSKKPLGLEILQFSAEDGGNLEVEDGVQLISLGSGFLIDSSGYIVTNCHVIADAEKVLVKLNDRPKEFVAKVVGMDKRTDLALLKIDHKKPLSFVKFGDSDAQSVGDWVVTIGNPFGLGSTVTSGIISAMGREVGSDGVADNLIQTDSALNIGNSGGAMFNMKGEVIGITNMIVAASGGGNIGIGFALPTSIALPVIDQLKKYGKVKRGTLGIIMQQVTDEVAESLGIDRGDGVLVVNVIKRGAAAKAGVKVGDIVLSFDQVPVKTSAQLKKLVGSAPIGKDIGIVVLRNGHKRSFNVSLAEDEADGSAFEADRKSRSTVKFGLSLQKLDDELRDKHGLDTSINGLLVTHYQRGSIWHRLGLKFNDVIVAINQGEVTTVHDFERAIQSAKFSRRKFFLMQFNRGANSQFLVSVPTKEVS